MRLGAHVSTAGGLDKAVDRAAGLGAEALQCFASSPQGWAFKPIPEEQALAFRQKAQAAGIGPVFLHGIYLTNLGTEIKENLSKGITSLVNYMQVASAIGAAGVIFHGGSHKGAGYDGIFKQTVDSLKTVLAQSPHDVLLIIENAAGMGNHIGSKFHEIGRIMQAVGDSRMKVCLDTQHTFAAGYSIVTPEGVDETIKEFDREIGLTNLAAVHANDSKTPFQSGVDRHENIGQGQMGADAFVAIMGHPAFRDVPFILEVPGFENKGPDKQNMDILKELRQRAGLKA
ncbi:MAG: deoxyribonuclease IV [Dehalococcoidia bacterium]|nr:deoxyribonuclease IV [Dehalococcoidia bacterium]